MKAAAFGALHLSVIRRAVAVAAVVLLTACGDDPTGNSADGSIRGTVTDHTGETVANAAVQLTGNGQSARSTSTDADGVYTFTNVLPGAYTLAVTAPAGFTIGAGATTSITVASEAEANPSAFVLIRVLNGSIAGTVMDNDALAGVANATVELTGNGQGVRTTISGADGIYTFADLPPGTYSLEVTPPGGFSLVGAAMGSATVPNGAQGNGSTFVLMHDSCQVVRPDFGEPATAEELALFAYDVDAPLNLEATVVSTSNGVEVSHITYDSPDGGSVPGILVVPIGRTGLRPGIVILHPGAMNAEMMTPYATLLAQHGAVVIAIDAPALRRGGTTIPLHTPQDSAEQVQLMKDLQRAVDVLIARDDVAVDRIGFEGYSYGGILGGQFVGIEQRLKAAALAAAHGGHVTGATSAGNIGWMKANLSCATRNAWFDAMIPIEPIRFIPHASASLLFQYGKFDTTVLEDDAEELADAAPEPKDVRGYNTGHGLNPDVMLERFEWWHEQIGIDLEPPTP